MIPYTFKTKADFSVALEAREFDPDMSICFIQDTHEIWVGGSFYGNTTPHTICSKDDYDSWKAQGQLDAGTLYLIKYEPEESDPSL